MAIIGLVALAAVVLYLLDRVLRWCEGRGWIRYRRAPRGWTRRIGPGAGGTIYDMINEDRRRALEIIVEERAGARDPEDRDGNLPELEHPRPDDPEVTEPPSPPDSATRARGSRARAPGRRS